MQHEAFHFLGFFLEGNLSLGFRIGWVGDKVQGRQRKSVFIFVQDQRIQLLWGNH